MEFPDEVYRDICCVKTLYSEKDGFFKEIIKIMLEKIEPEWIENVFKKQKSEVDKIRICCNEPKVWTTIEDILQNICKVYRKKCEKASHSSRLEGDSLRKEGNNKKAIMIYGQSIVRAPQFQGEDSEHGASLSLAYEGRAGALFALGYYRQSLADLNAALREGLPEPLRYRAYKLMGECYKGQLDLNKAQISLQVALKLIDDQILKLETTVVKHGSKTDLNKDKLLKKLLDKEREEIKEIMSQLPLVEGETKPTDDVPGVGYVRGALPDLTGGSSDEYPKASALVAIEQAPGAGRFAVAAGRIFAGATLIAEEPQASCLIPEMLASHCLHCFSRLFAAVPCRTCSGVAFCSFECRDAASATYHKYECEFLGLFLGSGMSVLSHLAFRMVTQESLSFFKRLQAKMDILKNHVGNQPPSNFSERESRYLRVFNLMTHSYLRTGKDYFRRTLMAIFLVKCLKATDYFDSETQKSMESLHEQNSERFCFLAEYSKRLPPDTSEVFRAENKTFSEEEILTASIILRHLELLQFNAHEIYETRVRQVGRVRDAKAVYIAVGVYPTAALFNHECAPSVTRYFNGKNIVIKAARPLEKGEILSENYGPHYAKKTLHQRLRELTSRYWFRCSCKACVEDWPTIDRLGEDHFKIKCRTPKCAGTFSAPQTAKYSESNPSCRLCSKKTNVADAAERKTQIEGLFDKGLELMDAGDCGRAAPLLAAYLDEIFDLAAPPCRQMFLCQEALRTCFAQTGNVWLLDEPSTI